MMMTMAKNERVARILIGEDEIIVAQDLADNLMELGYEVAGTVSTSEECIRLAEESQPDLILMDMKLKGKIDGIEAAEKIRTTMDVPVVYVTAFAETSLLERAKHTDPYGYLTKPVSVLALKMTVETALYKHEADKRVRESEERVQLALRGGNLGLWDWDLVTGDVYFNERSAAILGYSLEEIKSLTRQWTEFIHPEDKAWVMETVKAHLEGRTPFYESEHRRRHKSGNWIWVKACGQVVARDKEGNPLRVTGTHQDVTGRKKTEEALRGSETNLRSIFNAISEAVFLMERDGTILAANARLADRLGQLPEDLIGKNVYDYVPHEVAARRRSWVEEANLTGKQVSVVDEWQGRLVLHTIYPVFNSEGSIDRFAIYATDITESRKAERALKRSQAMIASILNTVPQSIFWKDREGVYLGCNKVFSRVVGLENPDEIVGKTDYELPWTREEADAYRADDREVLMTNIPKRHIVEPLRQADGTCLWIKTTKLPLIDQTNNVYAVLGVFEDITETRRAEEERRLNSQRLEALIQLGHMSVASLEELTSFAMEEAVRLSESSVGYVAFASEDESVLTMHAWSEGALRQCSVGGNSLDFKVVNTGLWGEAVRQRRPIITNDYPATNLWKKGTPEGHVRLVRHMNVPIFDDGRIVIVAGVGNKKTDYDENDVRQMTLLMEGMWRIIRRKRSEDALRESEEKYRLLVETMNDGVGIADAQGSVTYGNQQFYEMLGYSQDEIVGRNVRDLVEASKQSGFDEHFSVRKEGHPGIYETVLAAKNGLLIPVIVSSKPLFDEDGTFRGALAVFTNISELKKTQEKLLASLKEKDVLLQEIHHRVKNNLQLILSLLRIQSRKMEEPKVLEVLRDAQNRVFSLALVHEKLHLSPSLSTIKIGHYVKTLTSHVVQAYQGASPPIRVAMNFDDITFSIDTAVPLGMIVTELVSNVLRHAFPPENSGELNVTLHVLEDNLYELSVADNGVGISEAEDHEARKSLGLDLVKTLAAQLDGRVEIEDALGTRVRITFRDIKDGRPPLDA